MPHVTGRMGLNDDEQPRPAHKPKPTICTVCHKPINGGHQFATQGGWAHATCPAPPFLLPGERRCRQAPTGQELKEAGQQAVWEAEHTAWKEAAMEHLYRYCVAHGEIQADKFRAYCTALIGEPHHPNAWGSLYTLAARKKWMVKSKRHAASNNPAAHAHTYVVWYSRVCDEIEQVREAEPKSLDREITSLKAQLERERNEVARLNGIVAELKSELVLYTPKRK